VAAPHAHPGGRRERLLVCPEAGGAPAERQLQLLAYRQGDAELHCVREHGQEPEHCLDPRVRRQLQRVPRDERHGWPGLQQLNVKAKLPNQKKPTDTANAECVGLYTIFR